MTAQAGEPIITDSDSFEMYNLNKHLFVSEPNNYFLVRVCGYSMKDAGILPNDLLLVNRKKEAFDGDIIVASVNNGVVVKRLSMKDNITKLISDNEDYDDIEDQNLDLYL